MEEYQCSNSGIATLTSENIISPSIELTYQQLNLLLFFLYRCKELMKELITLTIEIFWRNPIFNSSIRLNFSWQESLNSAYFYKSLWKYKTDLDKDKNVQRR